MSSRTATWVIVAITFVLWMGARTTAIALPLVALEQTGEAGSTGLVLGAQAVPLATVGWWGVRLRERLVGGRAIAAVLLVKAAGLALVPVAAWAGQLSLGILVVCGLVVGVTSALDGPAVRALLADLGDRTGPGHAARALALQDLAHRATMFLAPPLGALAVGAGHTLPLLWAECGSVLVAAVALAAVPRASGSAAPGTVRPGEPSRCAAATGTSDGAARRRLGPATSPTDRDCGRASPSAPGDGAPARIRVVLRAHPWLAASLGVHGAVTLTWFAFSLGLAILGAQTGRPGELIAAGMAGYGLASTATAFAAPLLVNRLPAWPTAVLPAALLGLAYVVLAGRLDDPVGIGVLAGLGGLTMPLGIAAHDRLLATQPADAAERRAAFTADTVVQGSTGALGMLAGGFVIGAVGVPATLVGAGGLLIGATLIALAASGMRAARCGAVSASGVAG